MNKILIRIISISSVLFLGSLQSSGNVWADEHEEAEEKIMVQYYDLNPSFVANFGKSSRKLKFVKADVSLRSSSDQAVAAIIAHEPLVRHQIVMLLSRQTDEALSSSAGQESLRLEALSLVQGALEEETGSPQIDDLLFTSFVVQR